MAKSKKSKSKTPRAKRPSEQAQGIATDSKGRLIVKDSGKARRIAEHYRKDRGKK